MRKTYLNNDWRYPTFKSQKLHGGFVCYHNNPGLMRKLELSIYNPNEWKKFTDCSKRWLKCVLLDNGNLFGAVPIEHSVCLHKEHGDVKGTIDLLQYDKHNWIICVDFKMVCFLLVQQRVYTNYPCFFCMWDSRAREKHWVETKCPPRSDLKPGDPKILHEPLVDRKKTIFPLLHIKLGLMKKFVKTLPTYGDCFK